MLLACCLAHPAWAQSVPAPAAEMATPSAGGPPAPADTGDFAIHTESAPGVEDFAVHGQATYVWQGKPSFASPYEGPNSLAGGRARSYSFTTTLDLGWRLWQGAELHVNGEGARGAAFSDLHGLGGLTNGELAKTAGSDMKFYLARAFLRQAWGLGGGTESVAPDMNQLAGFQDKRRLVLTAGDISILDVFDGLSVSHDPRMQFMNWSFMTHGSYDYAADARGYSWGAVLEYIDDVDGWAVRAGRFMVPKESNGLTLDPNLGRHYGDQIEFEKSYSLWNRPGTFRILGFRNKAHMGSFDDAIALSLAQGGAPDLANVRAEHAKLGLGMGFEQALTDSATLFMRADFADGKTETYSFTEVDRSISGGVSINGDAWGRSQDTAGLAVSFNALSSSHRQYLQMGGLGAFLGDGTLDYGTERIAEAFYSWQPARHLWITADAQYIDNPGYNRDRGPAKVYSVRLHTEF